MARRCEPSTWLRTYLEYTKDQESPDIFHLWCGVSVIAATLERNVFLDRGYMRLRPNLYIILNASTASSRKSTAIDIATSLMREAVEDVNFIAQRESAEGLMHVISKHYVKTQVSAGYIVADELAMFLSGSKTDSKLVEFLTKLYGSQDVCEVHTLIRGKETCNNVCINMLAGTTPEWFKTSLPPHAVAGGFVGRIIFVHQEKGWVKNPRPIFNPALRIALVEDLRAVRALKGEYHLSRGAAGWFDTWYITLHDPDKGPFSLRGYFARKHDTLLKLGMVFAASKRDELIIEEEDLQTALEVMNTNEQFLPGVMEAIESSEDGTNLELIFECIKRRPGITRTELVRSYSYKMKARELMEYLDSLIAGGRIEEFESKKGRAYKEKGVEEK